MWRRPDNRRNSGDAYTTRVSNRGIQGFPPDPFSRKYAGRLLKANCAAQPKGSSACFVPQTHYEMQINRDFTLSRFYVEPVTPDRHALLALTQKKRRLKFRSL